MICSKCGSHKSVCTYDGEWCANCGAKYEGTLITYYEPNTIAQLSGQYTNDYEGLGRTRSIDNKVNLKYNIGTAERRYAKRSLAQHSTD